MYTYHALLFPSSGVTLVTLNAECEIVKAGILGRKVKNAIVDRQKRATNMGASLLVRTRFHISQVRCKSKLCCTSRWMSASASKTIQTISS